jgi:hypothetical protein
MKKVFMEVSKFKVSVEGACRSNFDNGGLSGKISMDLKSTKTKASMDFNSVEHRRKMTKK